jgi:hypothetical protein
MSSHHKLDKDDYSSIFYTPRTLSGMMLFLVLVNYFSYTLVPADPNDFEGESDKEIFKWTSKMY